MNELIKLTPNAKIQEVNANFETLLEYCKELEERLEKLEGNKCD